MTTFDKIIFLLKTYKGRDRFLRLLCYTSKCIGGLLNSSQAASQFDNFSKQLSASRACFRLLDDIPVLADIIWSRANAEQKGIIDKIVSIIENIVNLIFSPLDHISWAVEHKIIISNSTFWDSASVWCWIISLYIDLYKIVMKLSKLSQQKMEIISHPGERELKKKLLVEQWYLEMSGLKCLIDLLFAVNYLPSGLLWAGFFTKWQVGALGSLSSVINLYQAIIL